MPYSENAPKALDAKAYADIAELMLNSDSPFSFAMQIQLGIEEPFGDFPQKERTCGPGPAPNAYFLTANSALPVADAIREYYKTLGEQVPSIYAIAADRRRAGENSSAPTPQHQEEVARLRQLMPQVSHACIVDQFTMSGSTASYAWRLLAEAGAPMISTIRGYWYEGADPAEIDFRDLTSNHADFMKTIGYAAAQKL